MNSYVRLLFTLCLLTATGCVAQKSALRPSDVAHRRVAVVPFDSSNPYLSGSGLSDYFSSEILKQSRKIELIERKDMMQWLNTRRWTAADLVDSDQFSRFGAMFGADAVLLGSIRTLDTIQSQSGSILVTVKLKEIATGRLLWTDRQVFRYKGMNPRDVREVSELLMEKSARKMVRNMETYLVPALPDAQTLSLNRPSPDAASAR